MTLVVFFALLLLITLLGTYLIIENNRRKALEAKKKEFNTRVSEVTNQLKAKLNEYIDAKIMRPKYSSRLQLLTSNFFVVQPHTDENLLHLEKVTDSLINTLNSELAKTYVTGERDELAKRIDFFVAELPQGGIAYNKTFYHEMLPPLISMLKSPELSSDELDNNEKVLEQTHEPESENKAPTP